MYHLLHLQYQRQQGNMHRLHANPAHRCSGRYCLSILAATHQHLCFSVCTQEEKRLPIITPHVLETYVCGQPQLIVKIYLLGGCVQGLPLFTAPEQPLDG